MIELEVVGGTALITINRPDALNALDVAAYAQLSEAWTRVRDDDAIRAAVITGAGEKAFCAGADIKTFLGREEPIAELWATQRGQLLNRGLEVWKPVIAAVNGICVGGGMTLLLATDIRLAVPSARFGLSEVKRGVIAGNGGTQRALDQLPYPVAMELLLTGDLWGADKAERYGLINRIVEPDTLVDEAMALAARVASNAPLAVQATKELAVRSRDVDLAAGLRMEQAVNEILRRTEDAAEGIAAFREKRDANFVGR
ncbi:enoyl-CoA hydratase/carnithine racemase [Microbacterium sp. BE35]|uniref:enoyl-CoA hydratase/isomerase family protein n=1 Tax=Microbacterium sp. BE35 TaxID=2817773 RepID=UPI002867A6AE|nr:enoyl-CoA hydratase/isomerase family protein [Microbacterium sp. BE35]MDR7188228.1 enoyl-CoA hydratase/carnithine racemase [Microbacterium sp. BE35]